MDFRKLKVWQKAHDLALAVHDAARKIRGAEYTSLRSQMIRAAMSVDANIVEGRGQKSEKKFAQFLYIAINSANELESHLIMARDLRVMSAGDFAALRDRLVRVRKMLHGLLNKLNSVQKKEPAPHA
jgi:four helix bundle protein